MFFVRVYSVFNGLNMGVRDLCGHQESSGETIGNVDIVNKTHSSSKPSMNAGSCLSNSSIFAIKVRWTHPLSPLLSSSPGLIPPPQWWMRGIRNTSICMAKYLQKGSRV